MSSQPTFTITVDQNKYMPDGGTDVHAIVTASAIGGGPSRTAAEAAEVIIVDMSGSMSMPATKLSEAKRAAAVAVDALRDGVFFAIVAGNHEADQIYPSGPMVRADSTTRAAAKHAINRLAATGGTAMGKWLLLANRLLADHPDAIRHAILLTDGDNQHESASELSSNIESCIGHFTADCRGVGTDWSVSELRKIASALLGTIDIVARPEDLVADFQSMIENAMGKELADVALRIQAPQTTTIKLVKQVSPAVEDLTDKRSGTAEHIADYPTGSWGEETREYHLCLQVPPGPIGREMRAARVVLMAGEEQLASGNVLAQWTDDEVQATQINRRVAHFTGQEELADAVQEGLAARREGKLETATARLGRAAKLAHEAGNEEVSQLLAKVVDVVDLETGTARLKRNVDKADEMSLDTRSVRTVRTRPGA
jgi:hypothetical protein